MQVQAKVDKRHSPSVFSLEDEVIVVAPRIRRAVVNDDRLTIVGGMARFDRGQMGQWVPGYRLDLLPKILDDISDQPRDHRDVDPYTVR